MPAADKTMLGKGTKFGYALTGTAPYTYTYVPTVVTANPDDTTGETENKVLSTEFLPYLPTNMEAEWSVTIQYVPGDPAVVALRQLKSTAAIAHFQLLFPDLVSQITADGWIKQFSITIENDAIVEAELSIRIMTKPDFTALS